MSEEKKIMTQEEAEKDFQDKVFDIFSKKLDGVHRDKDGFIVVPMASRGKKDNSPNDDSYPQ